MSTNQALSHLTGLDRRLDRQDARHHWRDCVHAKISGICAFLGGVPNLAAPDLAQNALVVVGDAAADLLVQRQRICLEAHQRPA